NLRRRLCIPTRRSSDLRDDRALDRLVLVLAGLEPGHFASDTLTRRQAASPSRTSLTSSENSFLRPASSTHSGSSRSGVARGMPRSEEHTSELQSRENLV